MQWKKKRSFKLHSMQPDEEYTKKEKLYIYATVTWWAYYEPTIVLTR